MKILGIDTATPTASVALVDEGRLVLEVTHPNGDQKVAAKAGAARSNHAEIILPLVDQVLKSTGLEMRELCALAVSIGPGSFTGLRIGLSTVKGLAYGWGVSVVGVSTLNAAAARVTDWEGLVCPFLDARKKEVYAAIFRKHAEGLERLTDDLVSTPQAVLRHIVSLEASGLCLLIGDGIDGYRESIRGFLGDRATLTLGEGYPSIACAVARLASDRLRKSEMDPIGPLVPLYLRPSEAEVKGWGREDKS